MTPASKHSLYPISKATLWLVLFFLCYNSVQAQYFSNHYSLYAGTNGYISSIQVVNDTIYAMCFVGDSLNPAYSLAALERFDKYGDRISYSPVTIPTLVNIWVNNNTLIHTNDDGFAYGGYINIDSVQNALVILKYDHYGNLQWHNEIYDSSSLAFNCTAMAEDSFSNYYLTGIVQHLGYDVDAYIAKTDSSGSLMLMKVFLDTNFYDASGGLCINNKGHIVIGCGRAYINPNNLNTERGYLLIYELDTGLNELRHFLGTDSDGHEAGLIQPTNDGGYMCGGGYICYENISMIKNSGTLMKLDSNFRTMWTINAGPCSEYTSFDALTSSPDGNYIAVGKWHDDADSVVSHINGWIVKYAVNGQIIWSKLYRSMSATDLRGDDNELLSVGFLSDGSIICGGETETNDLTVSPDQQGWLLHLDTAGCLPDSNSCGIVNGIVNISPVKGTVKAYPNPASDQIQFEVVSDQPSAYTLSITDLLGQTVSEISTSQRSTGLDVRHWAPGLYLYKVNSEQGFEASGRFVVGH